MKIIVDTVEEKDEMIKMSKYLHDLQYIDTDQCKTLNTLCHLYICDKEVLDKIVIIEKRLDPTRRS